MLCNDRPGVSAAHLPHGSLIQKIPKAGKWHLAPSTNSALVQPFPVTAVVGALEWHFQGLPKSHLDVPKGQSCQQVTVPPVLPVHGVPGALEGSEQDREHFTAAFQQSSKGSFA